MFDDIGLTVAEAAEQIGVTPHSINQLICKEAIPTEKNGGRHYIEPAIVEAITELRKKHGKQLVKHAPWNGGSGIKVEPEEKSAVADEVPGHLNAELLNLSRKFLKAGCATVACKLQDVVLEQYDFTN